MNKFVQGPVRNTKGGRSNSQSPSDSLFGSQVGSVANANVNVRRVEVKREHPKNIRQFFRHPSAHEHSEFLQRFEFFNPDPPQWTKDPSDTLWFVRPDHEMINGRIILERLGDPMNKTVRLKTAQVTIKGQS